MVRGAGYGVETDEHGRVTREVDAVPCRHCQFLVMFAPGADPETLGGFCRLCMAHICPKCVGKPCEHFEKKLEAAERRQAFRRLIG